jgi:AraC-like DNA-binding protein
MDAIKPIDIQYYASAGGPAVSIPHGRRDFYKIWIILNEGCLHYADKSIVLTRPALIFSNPLVPYSYETTSEARAGYFCLFTAAFFNTEGKPESLNDSQLFKIGGEPFFFPDEHQLVTLRQLFDKMIVELDSDYIHKDDVIRSYIHLILHEALKMQHIPLAPPAHDARERITALFLELLDRQFRSLSPREQIQLRRAGDFARHLNIHVNHLNHVVREITGKPTSAHITARIVAEARLLLRTTDWTVNDIAWSLGFDYPNHFITFFRKYTGLTPLTARREAV